MKIKLHDPKVGEKGADAVSVLNKYFDAINDLKQLEKLSPTQKKELDSAIQYLEDTQYGYRSDGKPGKSGHTSALLRDDGKLYLLEIENSKPKFTEVASFEEIIQHRKIWNEDKQKLR